MTYNAYEISSVQKRMFLIHRMNDGDTVYNLPFAWIIEGPLEPEKLEKSIRKLIRVHESLRTFFLQKDDEINQLVLHELDFKLKYTQFTSHCEEEIDTLLEDFVRPLNLSAVPLWRLELVRLEPEKHVLLFDIHHIIFDGFSVEVFMKHLMTLYSGGEVPELEYQYVDYTMWHNDRLAEESLKLQEAYWLNRLSGELPKLELVTDHRRSLESGNDGDIVYFRVDDALSDGLKRLAAQENTTLYTLLLAAFYVLLYRYTRQEDIVAGSVIHGRTHEEFENIIGMFVNTLALREYPEPEKTFRFFLREVSRHTLEAFENQEYPFDMLVEKLTPQRDSNRNPFFDVMYVLQNLDFNIPVASGVGGELTIRRHRFRNRVARFDIVLMAYENEEKIAFDLEYRNSLFRRETIERMGNHFKTLLRGIVENPGARLWEIPLMLPEEKELVINGFNRTLRSYPNDKTIQELFREQVERTPDRVAVVEDMHTHMTYRELDRLSDRMASYLTEKGIEPGGIVALETERSAGMLIGLSGILKAGCAYLPIDPSQPEDRQQYMLKDANAVITLKTNKIVPQLPPFRGTARRARGNAGDMAYVIYTSGSTGRPKGVMVEHRSVVRLVKNTDYVDFGQYGRILQTGALDFDASTFEIWGVLLNGWTLHLEPRDNILNPLRLKEIVIKHRITTFFMTTALFHLVVDAEPTLFSRMRQILIGGEVLSPPHMNKVRKMYPALSASNIYGPTENTTFSTYIPLIEDYDWNVPIGKPIANSTAYIVDSNLRPVPVGIPGELIVGGDGVARGYMNNPELTDEKFIFLQDKSFWESRTLFTKRVLAAGGKLYKTGDLVRWKPDGNIEFLGRIDQQVKIRGFRIEPGEVENRIINHPDIKDAVVPVLETPTGEKYLCAYVVVQAGLQAVPDDFDARIKNYLSQSLPEYMVPSYIIPLEKIPLTANGKVDRRALPAPGIDAGESYVAPSGEIENRLVLLWSEILEIPADSISVTANFFDLGGHSLKATILTARIHQVFDVKIALKDIFIHNTIKELSLIVAGGDKNIYSAILPVEVQDYYPLSSAQKRIYFILQLQDTGTVYNMPTALRVIGKPDKQRLETAIRQLIQRHESLRTSFHLIDGEPVQRIHHHVDFSLESISFPYDQYDLYDLSDLYKSFVRPFQLSQAPLLRVGLVPVGKNESLLLFDMHHIISDGTSLGLLVEELSRLYDHRSMEPLPVQYKDFAVWQNHLFETGQIEGQEKYWLEVFGGGNVPRLSLPTDYPRPEVFRFQGDLYKFEMPDAPGFIKMARQNDATLHMSLMAAFNVLLHRYSGQEDIVVGDGIAGRPHADLQNVVGMFVNTLAIRSHPVGQKSYRQFLREVKQNSIKALENQDVQFEELVDRLDLERDMSRNPLFDVVLVVQNFRLPEIVLDDLVIKPYEVENRTSKFDITLMAFEAEDRVSMVLEYCTDLFTRRTIGQMAEHLNRIVRQVIDNPDIRISDIRLLNETEKNRLLHEFNDTQSSYPSGKTIHELFRQQAERTPDRVAVIDGMHTQMTYGELDLLSDNVALYLAEQGVEPGAVVALETGRSVEMLTGLLGILKAGCAYLPIDPSQPQDRQQYMLTDANAVLSLSTDPHIAPAPGGASLQPATRNSQPATSLCYIIYTSGSTGRPKGVMVEHRNVVRLVKNTDYVDFSQYGWILQTGALDFDASTFEIWGSLLNGWTLHLEPKENIINPGILKDILVRAQITAIWMTAPLFNQLCNADIHIFAPLRYLLVGGDILSPPHINRLREQYPHIKIINGYGPTENTTFSTTYPIDREYTHNIPIGKPIANSTAYILDRSGQPVPIGVPGELIVGGDGVSRGYMNNPELTADKFSHSKFKIQNSKLYKTGDLARWLPDGNIEFLGRIDQQVKIRGFRIEPGEIENRLSTHPGVREVVVIARTGEDGDHFLCAYVTGRFDVASGQLADELKGYLKRFLPGHMVPSYIVQLEAMPLTHNQKIDRSALPAPDSAAAADLYSGPENDTERRLLEIWSEILQVPGEQIGVTANFFKVGGHSLKAVTLISMIHKSLDARIALGDLFNSPTIRELAKLIHESGKDIYAGIAPVKKQDYYPVSSAQKRLYFLDQFEEIATTYNMPAALTVSGPLDLPRLEETFQQLIQRHETLRTSFHAIDGEPVQCIHDHVAFSLESILFQYDLYDPYDLSVLYKSFVRPFELSRAPLLRVGVAVLENDESLLLFDMHHIISDGTSMAVLVEDIARLYDRRDLEPLAVQYKDFAAWQNRLYETGGISGQMDYWLERFRDGIPRLNLPTDFPRPDVFSYAGEQYTFELDEGPRFLELARDNGATLYMNLLAAFNVLLYRYSGQEDIVVGTGIAGRPHADLRKMIGMFINSLAMRNQPDGSKTYKEFLLEVKENSIKGLENQDVQFEELVDRLNLERDPSHNPVFDVALVVQNFQSSEIAVKELVFKPLELEYTTAKFDITLYASENNEKIFLAMEYYKQIFTRRTIRQMAVHLDRIVRQVVQNPDIKISGIQLLDEEEKQLLLHNFNDTRSSYPDDRPIHRLFEEPAARTPGNIAVVSGGESITYSQLDETSNRIANYLYHEKQLRPGDRVGLLLEPSHRRVEAILGVLKAGGVYVPMEPSLPGERIKTMVDEAGIGIIVSDESFPALEAHGANDPGIVVGANDPAYIIFTSGTTGVPRGVMVEHRALVNLCFWHNRYYEITAGDRAVLYAGFGFDASVWELFPYILAGAAVHVIPDDIKLDMEALNRYFEENGITVAFLPTQVCEQFMRQDNRSLRLLLTGGDKLRQFKKNNYRLYNNYGPTENAVVTTACPVTESSGNIPIGKPIDNNRVYILHKDTLDPQPVGVPGELCIAGDSLARGYINNPELTAQKFINSKFKIQNSKLYKSGDLCRWLPDGNIEFLGRIDQQVKIRGFRIEPGEIETRLMEYPGVDEAVVTVSDKGDGDKYLCACVVGTGFKPVRTGLRDDLRAFLSERLPDYMVPAHFVFLDELPLTSSGKVDRRALPVPDLGDLGTGKNYVAPMDDIESRLVEIWSDSLDITPGSISTTADFFQVGGHSLKATNLISRIHRAFDVKIPLAKLFKTPTIQALRSYIKNAHTQLYTALEPAEKKEYYPLSSPQKRIYVLQQVDKESIAYNVPMIIQLDPDVCPEKLESVFKQLIQRHEALRTSFHMIEEQPVQRIHDHVPFTLESVHLYDLSDLSDPYVLSNKLSRPFDLSRAPLLRAVLITGDKGARHLFIDMHHIATDGTSHFVLEKDFFAMYRGDILSPLPLQYKDYAESLANRKQDAVILRQEKYWLGEFSDEIPVLDIPGDFPRPDVQGFEGGTVDIILGENETRLLKTIARDNDITLYMCLLALFNILFAKLTRQEDIVIGTPIAARRHIHLESIVGMFVNTLVMRNYPTAGKPFDEFLREVKQRTLEAYENQEYPFEDLVDRLALRRDAGRNPIFDVMLNLLNQGEYRGDVFEANEGQAPVHRDSPSKFDLNITVVDLDKRLLLEIEYSTALFKPETIERYTGYFRDMTRFLGSPGKWKTPLHEIDYLDAGERQRLAALSNGDEVDVDTGETIHRLFETRAREIPNQTALVLNGTDTLTYRQLNSRANRLAHRLRQMGAGPNVPVGLVAERSFQMIIGMLAILKAGGAYVPIDAEYPEERKSYMIADSGIDLVLTNVESGLAHNQSGLAGNQSGLAGEIIDLNDESNYTGDDKNPDYVNSGGDLLYIIYTSGSTGKPKGVMLEHRNLVNLMHYQYSHTHIDFSNVLQFTTISFDVSAQEIFSTLIYGGVLHLIDLETRNNIPALFDIIRENDIKTLFFPASFLKFVMNEEAFSSLLPGSVDHIVTAGEQVIVTQKFKDYLISNKICLHNHYGPSETHVVTALTLEPGIDLPRLPAIGRPVSNTAIYLLDRGNHPVPVGVPGELYIGGLQVGRGYLNRPGLTHEKYINSKLYKTGDLARWLPDGNIEFLGRIDHQVKIRGFRVELGEIEHRLLDHPDIKEAVVSAHRDDRGNNDLCAYVVPVEGKSVTTSTVREYLAEQCPDYMVPTYIMPLEAIPLTPNRKIDRTALPKPEMDERAGRVAPGTASEKKLAGIWAHVLGTGEDITGIDDDFFEMGGHSLKGTVLAAHVHKTFQVELPLGVLFKTPTIRQLARYIDEAGREVHSAPEAGEKKEYYPLSSVQKRLYTVFRFDPESTAYNITWVALLEGELDIKKSEDVFRQLIRRHESMRTSFPLVNEQPVQRVHREIDFSIRYSDSGDRSPVDILRRFTRAFDLAEAPLFRVGLIRTGEARHILVLDFHHIIFDGVSNAVFRKDFMALYSGQTLPAPRLQYRDYTQWMNRPEQVETIGKQGKYWYKQFKDGPPLLELPGDFPRPESHSSGGSYNSFLLNAETTAALNRLAREEGTTLYILLLAVFYVFLHRLSGQEDIVVGTSIAGRSHADLQNIIGMFVNALALRNFPKGDNTFREFLLEVKSNVLEAFDNQDYPFEELVAKVAPKRIPGRNPIFDVMFILNNEENPEVEIAGLTMKPYEGYEKTSAQMDMKFRGMERGDVLLMGFEFSTALFKAETIQRFVDFYKELVGVIINNRDTCLREIKFEHGLESSNKELDEMEFNF